MAGGEKSRLEQRREWLYEVIFGYDTPAGRAFDVALLLAILASVLAVVLESVDSVQRNWGTVLRAFEWLITGLFTVEYVLRVWVSRRRMGYVLSVLGIVDLLAILPSFIGLFLAGAHSLAVIRVLRLLRVFRVLKLVQFLGEESALIRALRASLPKITVFLGAILSSVVIVGAAMHLIEGPENGFEDIPRSMYWAIVTMTTVGYGDIAPQTVPGRILASALMILGYGLIAVPTGVFSAELVRTGRKPARDERGSDED
jgi:voltage-gated potassium channel